MHPQRKKPIDASGFKEVFGVTERQYDAINKMVANHCEETYKKTYASEMKQLNKQTLRLAVGGLGILILMFLYPYM